MTIYKDECLPFESEDVLVFNDNPTIIDSELKFDDEHLRMLDEDIII